MAEPHLGMAGLVPAIPIIGGAVPILVLFLSHLLHEASIDCVVLEARGRTRLESRIRAGVLESRHS